MNRLKELRNIHGLSQKAFASIFGVAQNTVSNWENGNRLIDNETLSRIAEYYGVSIDYILGREIPDHAPKANPTDDEIKFALFGGTDGTNIDEAWDDVKDFVQFIRQKYNLDGKGDD